MKMFTKKKFGTVFKLSLAAWVICVAVPAAEAANRNFLRATVAETPGGFTLDETRESTTGPVSFDSSPGSSGPLNTAVPFPNTSRVAGAADFGALSALARASSGPGFDSRQASVNASTSYTVFINLAAPGGGPALNVGDPVSLNLSLRLDGILNSAAAPGDNSGLAEMSANFKVVDSNHPTLCGEGCLPMTEFRAQARSSSSGIDGFTFNSWNWSLQSRDLLDTLIDQQSDSAAWDIGPGSTCLPGAGNNFCLNDINFDTGILSTTIETYVGASLDLLGQLNVFSIGTNFGADGAFGSADFLDTFGLVLTPNTPGIQLDYAGGISPALVDLGAPAVPVPAAVWLFGSGLIGLVAVARRKRP